MRVLLAASVLVVVVVGDARAEKRKVLIESDPPGADVYLNSKEDGSICKTPCTIDAPVGDTPIIVEVANHLPLMENLSIPRRGKPAIAKFKLLPAVGTIIVSGPRGAMIRVNEIDRGKAPTRFEIEAGPHTVNMTLNGKELEPQLVDVDAGGEVTVKGAAKEVAEVDPPPGNGETGTTPNPPDGGGITRKATPKPPRGKIFAVSGLFDVGFRDFDYSGVVTPATLRKEEEGGQILAGPMIEVWPGTIAGVRKLRGLSLMVRLQFPLNKQPVTGDGIMGTTTTFWQSFEASVRHRWTIGTSATIEANAGFVRDQYQFNTNRPEDIDLVPDVDYRSIRVGGRGSLLLGSLEPYLALENRIVMSGGSAMEERFSLGANASGLRGALGISANLGSFAARLEGSLTRYAWTFKYASMDQFKADAATDSIKLISFVLGYAY